MLEYDRVAHVWQPARITVRIEGDVSVPVLVIDHIGDGLAAPVRVEAPDLRGDVTVHLLPARMQTIGWAVSVADACGRSDVTGLPREMVVVP